jgi:D-tyrosyl-tRNA(Tyr) deacylase
MRAVVQRVRWARVKVGSETVGEIGPGLLVLLGAAGGDTEQDVEYTAAKAVNLRIFEDEQQNLPPGGGGCGRRGEAPGKGQMNRSLLDVGGSMLVVSQFTLCGDCRKGRRPSFTDALEPGAAERLCDLFAARCRALGPRVETGRFRAMMDVELCNAGPVTLLLDSRRQF